MVEKCVFADCVFVWPKPGVSMETMPMRGVLKDDLIFEVIVIVFCDLRISNLIDLIAFKLDNFCKFNLLSRMQ
ncbi:hypothetical protein MOSE0_M00408 [Monosporozyma servazzii]